MHDTDNFETFNRETLIAIPVFNRAACLLRLLESLYASQSVLPANVHVFDDASDEFDTHFLRCSLQATSQLIRHDKNSGGADQAVERIFQFFLRSEYQQLLLLDSDLIVANDWLQASWRGFAHAQGLLSLFNTPTHYAHAPAGPGLVKKNSVGFAGTLWSRELVSEVLQQVDAGGAYDWDICAYLQNRRNIMCLLESCVQHLGVEGQNSRLAKFDYGAGFAPGNMVTANILARESEKIIFALKDLTQDPKPRPSIVAHLISLFSKP